MKKKNLQENWKKNRERKWFWAISSIMESSIEQYCSGEILSL